MTRTPLEAHERDALVEEVHAAVLNALGEISLLDVPASHRSMDEWQLDIHRRRLLMKERIESAVERWEESLP